MNCIVEFVIVIVKLNSKELESDAKFVTRCLDKLERGDFFIEDNIKPNSDYWVQVHKREQ